MGGREGGTRGPRDFVALAGVAGILAFASGCAGSGTSRELPTSALQVGTGATAGRKSAFTLDEIGAFLGAGSLFIQNRESPSGVERGEIDVQERAGLGLQGTVLSPGFLRYEGTGVFGLTQAWANDGEETEYDDGDLYEVDTSLNFFSNRIHPANLYYSRYQDFRPRLFLSMLESTTTLARAEQNLNLDDGTFRIAAEHREIEQETLGQGETSPFLDVKESDVTASGDYRLTREQSVYGGYTYRDVDQQDDEQDFREHDLEAYHDLKLGEASEFQLRSRVEATFQDGALNQDLVRWTETLNSQITKELRADGLFYWTVNDNDLTDLDEKHGEFGFTHQLYDSLTTRLRMQGTRTENDDVSKTDTLGPVFGLNYLKKTGLGTLRVGYSGYWERRFVDNGSGGVIDESYRFPAIAPEEVRLIQRFVILATLTVTDPSGLVRYREGTDYVATQDEAGVTTLTRIFTGNIPPGGDILVDYAYEIGADFVMDTLIQDGRIEHEFEGGWTPYFGVHYQGQNIVDSDESGTIVPIRELGLLGGLEWRHPTWLVGSEYEHRESTILPFDAVRLRGQISQDIAERQWLTLYASQSWFFYHEPDRETATTQWVANWNWNLTRDALLSARTALYYTDDSLQGSSVGFSIGGTVDYRWRGFSFRLRVAHQENHSDSTDYRGEEVAIWIVREFGSLPATTEYAKDRFLRQ